MEGEREDKGSVNQRWSLRERERERERERKKKREREKRNMKN